MLEAMETDDGLHHAPTDLPVLDGTRLRHDRDHGF